jgi:hypothetical protein
MVQLHFLLQTFSWNFHFKKTGRQPISYNPGVRISVSLQDVDGPGRQRILL